MKYIGSGLWALASAYLEVKGYGAAYVFFCMAVLIAFFGGNKSLVTVNNATRVKDGEK